MDTKPIRRNPSVQVNEHSGFALELMRYLNHVKGDGVSGRAFAKIAAAGSHDHWAKILSGAKVMTTNDIKIAADAIGMTPYEFVAGARDFAANVGGDDDDRDLLTPEQELAIRQEDLRLAALRGRNDADVTHAD